MPGASHWMTVRVLLLCCIATSAAAGDDAASPYKTDVCPIPATVHPYWIVVRSAAGTVVETQDLKQLANRAGGYMSEMPKTTSVVHMEATLAKADKRWDVRLIKKSSNRRFDNSLLLAVQTLLRPDNPSFALASVPQGAPPTLLFLFGEEPTEGEVGVRELAMQDRTPSLLKASTDLPWPVDSSAPRLSGEVLVWVSFPKDGAPASVFQERQVQSSNPMLAQLATTLVPTLQFRAGETNCEPVTFVLRVLFTFVNGKRVKVEIPQR